MVHLDSDKGCLCNLPTDKAAAVMSQSAVSVHRVLSQLLYHLLIRNELWGVERGRGKEEGGKRKGGGGREGRGREEEGRGREGGGRED